MRAKVLVDLIGSIRWLLPDMGCWFLPNFKAGQSGRCRPAGKGRSQPRLGTVIPHGALQAFFSLSFLSFLTRNLRNRFIMSSNVLIIIKDAFASRRVLGIACIAAVD